MATYGQLKNRVVRKLGLDDTAFGDEDSAVGEWLNEGVLEILLETHCYISRDSSVALTDGTGDYELDTDILAIHTLLAGTVPLVRVSEEEIHWLRRSASASSTVMRYAVAGANMLMVYPTPSAAVDLAVYFVPRPTPMSDESHDPADVTYGGIPSEHHKAIEFYALWQGADYDTVAAIPPAQREQDFERYLGKMRRSRSQKGGRQLSPARMARSGRVTRSPSEDLSPWG
jgi:hypothetical protein